MLLQIAKSTYYTILKISIFNIKYKEIEVNKVISDFEKFSMDMTPTMLNNYYPLNIDTEIH